MNTEQLVDEGALGSPEKHLCGQPDRRESFMLRLESCS